ncbi:MULTISPECIES: DegT/DnrJ/EryC1/StrS family aminotransferase [Mycobacterium]|uniref:DegT/DnrJ/EryC1/StrS aminotransferase n=2 Tax=Mycobacterium intracellulare TaxID=1767 RepID=B2NIA8_MYCIT|nr:MULTISPECIES: DegT/DnrJ/EryC1/StrS family aminotransferase [Mycobacterium]MCA2232274.1 DegT/DnrJ/EryC1/StrS family aminotransferase [Mycobacterium intracellulare]UGU08884.1 DegT/DnrJ/EryC1/StrS family aminotransferase [Mycobacterium intracellulare subsp. intracellulare]WSE53398.1 DegT/DnrJ/EryC1/StrS family aminotransferase [Mycobacterium sp. 2-64]BAG31972.1 DegT/DnrJ/EryC1/StrS aminotransferase [Mycobacterium intracellulare]
MPDLPAQVPFLDVRAATQEIDAPVREAVERVVRSGWYVLGEETAAFEREFAEFTEARHAVGVGNGLDAITLALKALGIGPGDEVIVPAHTFIATWIAVAHTGARPVGVEPVVGQWNLDPARVAESITPRTRALVPVHLFGQPADLAELLDMAKKHGLVVVEDAAQAHGARYSGRRIGAHSDAVAWSFYPGKNLGALGDGGAVTTDDAGTAARVRSLGNYGSSRKYVHDLLGANSRLDEIQAAVLRVKLQHLDDWNARRHAIAKRYTDELADVPGLRLPAVAPNRDHVWHLYVVDHALRDELQNHLTTRGIQTLVHYPIPPHRSGAFASLELGEGAFPITEQAARTHLSLPMGPHLRDEDISRVVDACRSFTSSPDNGDVT